MRCWAVFLCSLLLVGCASTSAESPNVAPSNSPTPDADVIYLPAYDLTSALPEALVTGTLRQVDGCVSLVTQHADAFVLLWPRGWTGRRRAGGFEILDPTGGIHEEGSSIVLGGGELTATDKDFVEANVTSLAEQCKRPPYWLVTGLGN